MSLILTCVCMCVLCGVVSRDERDMVQRVTIRNQVPHISIPEYISSYLSIAVSLSISYIVCVGTPPPPSAVCSDTRVSACLGPISRPL